MTKQEEIREGIAWVVCRKCNNAKHRILPSKEVPFWYCQDEKYELKPSQEIEVEYAN